VPTDPIAFIQELRFQDLPPSVVEQACRCLLDLAGVAAAGSTTAMSRIACDHAVEYLASPTRPARLLFDGRAAGPVGAAFAGAATIDSFDAHDGHALTKGHAGVAVLPALLAFADSGPTPDGREFLTALVLGYEIATRAGINLHATAVDYHTSGAWNALGAAAIGARLLGLNAAQTREALGIAEFHGPRSQMMRCIDHPTMVKDGSAVGAAAGVSAALLASASFTGAPAVTMIDDQEHPLWGDLGDCWRISEQYFKPFPVCRWAHPAVQVALDLRDLNSQNRSTMADIDHLEITTFHAATRLATRHPATTEQAQYSLPFAVATAFVHGTITAAHLETPQQAHPDVTRLSATMKLQESTIYEQQFPAQRHAHGELILRDDHHLHVGPTTARGGPDQPLTNDDLTTKYHTLTDGILSPECTTALQETVHSLSTGSNTQILLENILKSPIPGPA